MTIASEITQLETELVSVRRRMSKIEHLKSTEEGSSTSRFYTQFTEINKLENREHKILARLNTLKGYSE